MPHYCIVPCCLNTKKNTEGTDITFHRIPTTRPSVADVWLKNIRHVNSPLNSNCYVCSKHFRDECFTPAKEILPGWKQKRVLKANSVPTLFDFNEGTTTNNEQNNVINIKSEDSRKRLFEDDTLPSLVSSADTANVSNGEPMMSVMVDSEKTNHIEQVPMAPVSLREAFSVQIQPRKKTKSVPQPKHDVRISASSVTNGVCNSSTQTYWFGKSKLSQANLLPYHMLKLIGCQTDVTMPQFDDQQTQADFPARTRIYVDAETQTCTVKNKITDVMLHIDLQHLEDHNYSKGPQPTYEYSDHGKNTNIFVTSLKIVR